MASYPVYSHEGEAQQLKMDMYSLKAKKSARRSHIKIHPDATASLGPWPVSAIPEAYFQNYHHAARCPTIAFRESPATFVKWQKNHQAVQMGEWPTPSKEELAWYKSRRTTDLEH